MIYKPKNPTYINAFKFMNLNDIPEDLPSMTPFTYPGLDFNQRCPSCGKPWLIHGSFNGNPICPEQYILYKNNKITSIMGLKQFEDIYISICTEDAKEIIDGSSKERNNISKETSDEKNNNNEEVHD